MDTAADTDWMRQALKLAARGMGRTRPNPPVGAIVVAPDGRLLGAGYHRRAGGPHAEVLALRQAGAAARGATLYVTLEPCCTFGRTPPCTAAILRAGIARVVVGTTDPNPRHAGRGPRKLRRAGVEVACGVCRDEARRIIAPFARWVTTGRPLVTLKLGASLDGRIADGRGRSRWITCPASRRRVQALRRGVDAIVVGAHTVRRDDPGLLCGGRSGPWRVVVDGRRPLPLTSRVLTDAAAERTIVATTRACPAARRLAYARCGARVWILPARRGRVSSAALCKRLGREGILHALCEGGGELAAALIAAGRVDRYVWFAAPLFLGGAGVPAIGGRGWPLARAPRLRITAVSRCGRDAMIEAVACD
jgi:diaminohydroxyphosphoribosylaminopyrimidine deaminase/5-amino-6-(5-phosphoribosylamino)uracil reductase